MENTITLPVALTEGALAEIKRLMSKINLVNSKYIKTNNKDANQKIAAMAKRVRNLCSMIVLLNIMVVMYNKTPDSATVSEQTVQTQADEFSYTAATIYDNDNTP